MKRVSQSHTNKLEAEISRAMARTPKLLKSPKRLREHFEYLAKLKDQRGPKTREQIERELGLRYEQF